MKDKPTHEIANFPCSCKKKRPAWQQDGNIKKNVGQQSEGGALPSNNYNLHDSRRKCKSVLVIINNF